MLAHVELARSRFPMFRVFPLVLEERVALFVCLAAFGTREQLDASVRVALDILIRVS